MYFSKIDQKMSKVVLFRASKNFFSGHAATCSAYRNFTSPRVQKKVRFWPNFGQIWPKIGQKSGKSWPKLAKIWPKIGKKLGKIGKSWPKFGQNLVLIKIDKIGKS